MCSFSPAFSYSLVFLSLHQHLLSGATSIRGFVGELSLSEGCCEPKCPLQSHSWPRGLNIEKKLKREAEAEACFKKGEKKKDLDQTLNACCMNIHTEEKKMEWTVKGAEEPHAVHFTILTSMDGWV